MEAVGGNQQGSHAETLTVVASQRNRHSLLVRVVAIARDSQAGANGIGTQAFQGSAIQKYLQPAAVNGILRPLVTGP